MNITTGIGSAAQALNVLSTASSNAADAVKLTNNGVSAGAVQQNDATSLTAAGGLVTQALTGEDTRAGKVEALQAAIAAGTYNVPASAVVDKLIQSMLG